ncbi:Uncharacterized protein conserved in bacteria [Ewingella americana]|uniref:Uncharacterized protein conserved in bacteria n=1 Tax=Ewingella americana TaxID=41202 RepID=A0A377NCI6_9GAMM|nr:Uncharacterized protein conserved in bacteria [Ewingella americana]
MTEGAVYQLADMKQWQEEKNDLLTQLPVAGWQTTLASAGSKGQFTTSLKVSPIIPRRTPAASRGFMPNG